MNQTIKIKFKINIAMLAVAVFLAAAAPGPATRPAPAAGGIAARQLPGFVSSEGVVVMATGVMRDQVLDLDSGSATRRFELTLSIHVPPGQKVLGAAPVAQVTRALDAAGRSLVPGNQPASKINQVNRAGTFSVSAPLSILPALPAADGPGKRLASLRGSFRYITEEKTEQWVIEDPLNAHNVVCELPTERLTFVGMVKKREFDSDMYEVSFRTVGKDNNAPLVFRGDMRADDNAPMCLIDGIGRGHTKSNNTHWTPDLCKYTFYIDSWSTRPGPPPPNSTLPAVLVIDVPTEIKEHIVSFEFKDLPLP